MISAKLANKNITGMQTILADSYFYTVVCHVHIQHTDKTSES